MCNDTAFRIRLPFFRNIYYNIIIFITYLAEIFLIENWSTTARGSLSRSQQNRVNHQSVFVNITTSHH